VQWCANIVVQLGCTPAQTREAGDMDSAVVLEKRLLASEQLLDTMPEGNIATGHWSEAA